MRYSSIPALPPFTKIILGCAALGEADHGVIDKEALKLAVHQALDEGINTFDVADCYGLGLAEENLSNILGSKRKEVNIITKFGIRWERVSGNERAKTFRDISPNWAEVAVENSLKRLKIECIPVYFVHWPDGKTPIEETVTFLSKLRDAGKIQHIGLSNFSSEDVARASRVASISFVQYSYSLIDRKIEDNVLSTCSKLTIKVLCYGALAQGLLSGKYNCREVFDKNDHRSRLSHFAGNNENKNEAIIAELKDLSVKYNSSVPQIAIAWALKNKYIGGAILGAKTSLQVKENITSLGIDLSEEDYRQLNKVSE